MRMFGSIFFVSFYPSTALSGLSSHVNSTTHRKNTESEKILPCKIFLFLKNYGQNIPKQKLQMTLHALSTAKILVYTHFTFFSHFPSWK